MFGLDLETEVITDVQEWKNMIVQKVQIFHQKKPRSKSFLFNVSKTIKDSRRSIYDVKDYPYFTWGLRRNYKKKQ